MIADQEREVPESRPSDDERKAMIESIQAGMDYYAREDIPEDGLSEAEQIADFLSDAGFRRTVQDEPTEESFKAHEDTPTDDEPDALCGDWPAPCNCDDPDTHDGTVPRWLVESERRTVPGEPSDAQVKAALDAWVSGDFFALYPASVPYWEPKMRAALVAAAKVQEGEA